MVRSAQRPLTGPRDILRVHLHRVVSAGIGAASAHDLLSRALRDPESGIRRSDSRVHVIAAGKAASSLTRAVIAEPDLPIARVLAVGTHRELDLPPNVEWHGASHPVPDERSVAAAERALEVARGVAPNERLLLLLSGGASSLLCAPLAGLTLDEKSRAIRALITSGADIRELNAVRKHISAIKGGRLAAACPGWTTTLAVSDVVGDDLSVIGSGPGVADPSSWQDALDAFCRWTPPGERVGAVLARLEDGVAGRLPETPKPGDDALARTDARIIGGRRNAIAGAREAAEKLGYAVTVINEPITGEARITAAAWLARAQGLVSNASGPLCIVSAGETTVRVTGPGRGGRNQEFALAMVEGLQAWQAPVVAASVGTDGIDGPTSAAGAIVDATTAGRAEELQLGEAVRYLDANDSYTFFHALGDLVQTGRTDTNVGDLQVLLYDPQAAG